MFNWFTSWLRGLFGNVYGAWEALEKTAKELEDGTWHFAAETVNALTRILLHYIPAYAMTAWWWVTNPSCLASVLYWWIVKYLEERAWCTAQYLGEFLTALVARNLRTTAHLLETIIAAVL